MEEFTGRKKLFQHLFDLGLINKVLPHDQLLPYVRERALKLIPPQGAENAVRMAKRAPKFKGL